MNTLKTAGMAALVALALSAAPVAAQMHGGGHGNAHGHGHGADGTGHDMVNMPGLRGENATPEETAELALMFRYFALIEREVELLENGIRTVTRSDDAEVAAALISHIAGMTGRVADKDDPKIFIQSPTLDIIFERGDSIVTEIEPVDGGLAVLQTSDDPEVVKALQVHAAEVTAMVDRGMDAVHEMMMNRRN